MKLLFIHRSVGHNLILHGNLRERLHQAIPGLLFDDYDQNYDVLTHDDLHSEKPGLVFPGGNTRPEDFADIFTDKATPEATAIRDMALAYDVVILKSCYPNSNIRSPAELDAVQGCYRQIAKFFAADRPNKQLIILTSPPLRKNRTSMGNAQRARILAEWLAAEPHGPNTTVFNFFAELADARGFLRKEYQTVWPWDSHPSPKASREIAPRLTNFLAIHVRRKS